MVEFIECEAPATAEEIEAVEKYVGYRFPAGLRRLFESANGGRPEPYIFRHGRIDTAVSECLPLRTGKNSALATYEILIRQKKLLPDNYFPFAVDGTGDYFFVDCTSADALVTLYVHDTAFEHVVPLNIGIEEFWSRMTS